MTTGMSTEYLLIYSAVSAQSLQNDVHFCFVLPQQSVFHSANTAIRYGLPYPGGKDAFGEFSCSVVFFESPCVNNDETE